EDLRALGERAGMEPRDDVAPQNLADLLAAKGAITPQTAAAVRGLAALRNLAAHSSRDDNVDRARAKEYVVLAQGTRYALEPPPPLPPPPPPQPARAAIAHSATASAPRTSADSQPGCWATTAGIVLASRPATVIS